MPSPFPGMDPYLEAPDIWPDCHNALASQIRDALNRDLPRPYYARLEMRPEIGIVDEEGTAPPRRELSRSYEVEFLNEPIQHGFVEIRDASRDHRLVTLIEILSPSNKRGGADREAYAKKQREVIESDASLVEIDLLRAGRRVLPDARLAEFIDGCRPRPSYVVLVSPAWKREGAGLGYVVYPIALREPLPCVGIPLRADLPLLPLDVQHAFGLAYDGGPYRRGAVDYAAPPDPPLAGDDAAWAEGLLREPAGP